MNSRLKSGWLIWLAMMAVPCGAMDLPGDLNGDGAVDTADLDRMRAVFMTEDSGADLNGDGIVNYGDLAILRSLTPGGPSVTLGGGNPVISITPATGSYEIGEQIETLVSADFAVDPTIGGTFDILYDDTLLDVVDFQTLPIGDPDFYITPTLTPGVIVGTGFGEFDGVVAGDVIRITFEVVAAVDLQTGVNPTALTMRDGSGGGGGFFSAITTLPQTVDYQGAEYTLPVVATYPYVGVASACSPDCDAYVALGGTGAANPTPSYLLGFLQLDAGPGDTFTTADILAFRFELGNDARPEDSSADPTLANPYVIDANEGTISASGMIGLDGVLDTGQVTLSFLNPPLSTRQARLNIDIAARQFALSFDDGVTPVAGGDGGFLGQTRPAQITVAPPALGLGSVQIGQESTAVAILRNVGLADLSLGAVGAADPLAAPFAFDGDPDCASQILAPGATCIETVRFAPQSTGNFEDAFDIPSSDAGTPVVTLPVSGQGVGVPNIVIAPSLDFGELGVGSSAELDLTIGNDGTDNLSVTQVNTDPPIDAPFAVAIDGCSGQVLAPAETCTVTLEFAPQTVGVFTEVLSVESDDPDQPIAAVALAGRTPANPAILTISGVAGGAASCRNVGSFDQKRILLFGGNTLDCQAAGLAYVPGADLLLSAFAQVDDSAGPIGGSLSGVAPRGAVCVNIESGQNTVITLTAQDTGWDCTAAGLLAAPGDRVLIFAAGLSN